MSFDSIKSMQLYSHLERFEKALAAAGIGRRGALRVADLSPYDQLHYHGTAAVDAAIAALRLGPDDRVAEVGSGLGGPARYLADRVGCQVTALELQADLNALARDLTARCGLAGRVAHLCGNVLDGPLKAEGYDAVVSWLAFYHIADHRGLFTRLFEALGRPGRLFIEDLCTRRPFTDEEWEPLSVEIYARRLPTSQEYHGELSDAGFRDIEMVDMSDDWADFTHRRACSFEAERARQIEIQGAETVTALGRFYAVVDSLFQGGNLGGLRIVACKG